MDFAVLKKSLNICLTDLQKVNLEQFTNFFENYNTHTNLMSKNDIGVLFEKHIFDSLALNLFFLKYKTASDIKLLDIGTGGGFPALPVAVCFDKIDVTAIDSIQKKVNFIKEVKDELNLENILPICARIEELSGGFRNGFDIVTSRAVADLRVILEYAIPYVKHRGYFVAFKSKNTDAEINNAQNALNILGAEVVDKIPYILPIAESPERYLLIIKKTKKTSNLFPRKNGQPKKNPL